MGDEAKISLVASSVRTTRYQWETSVYLYHNGQPSLLRRSQTYCTDAQIADSACTATAYLCGAKANRGTIGVTARVARWDCAAARAHPLDSIAAWALADGRDVGWCCVDRSYKYDFSESRTDVP